MPRCSPKPSSDSPALDWLLSPTSSPSTLHSGRAPGHGGEAGGTGRTAAGSVLTSSHFHQRHCPADSLSERNKVARCSPRWSVLPGT